MLASSAPIVLKAGREESCLLTRVEEFHTDRYSNSKLACRKPIGEFASVTWGVQRPHLSPTDSSMVPVIVVVKMESTCSAKDETRRNLTSFFAT